MVEVREPYLYTRHGHPLLDQAFCLGLSGCPERMVDWRMHALGRGTVHSPSRPCSSAIHLRSTVLTDVVEINGMAGLVNPANTMISPRQLEYGVLSLSPSEREPLSSMISSTCSWTDLPQVISPTACVDEVGYAAPHHTMQYMQVMVITCMVIRSTEVMEHHPLCG